MPVAAHAPFAENAGLQVIGTASHRSTNLQAYALITAHLQLQHKVLDLGAGRGHLSRRIGQWFTSRGAQASQVLASDIATEGFQASEVPFQAVDFNRSLPFADASFDLVYSIEVFEHLHRPYDTLAQCYRILKPGGRLVVSTPNILQLGSRLRFFFTGFYDLYEPPSSRTENAGRICGHVMPLHIAYYAYSLRSLGFGEVHYHTDRLKKGARVLRWLLLPILSFAQWRFKRHVLRYDAQVFAENAEILKLMGSADFLTSRSLMFVATKPLN